MKSVIFLAPPAAGKGTFSDYLVKQFGYKQLSTGDILRKKAHEDKALADFLKTGALVDDDTIMAIVKEELEKMDKNQPFILDGIPRTLQQAKVLDIILTGLDFRDVVVAYIDVEKEILIDRVVGRRVCKDCHRSYNENVDEFKPKVEGICDDCHTSLVHREDDNQESFMVRYTNYLESTYPVVTYYKEKGCLKVLRNNEVDQTEALNTLREVLNDN